MSLQLTFLVILVSIEVAATRLIYHDGVSRQITRMRNHCRILAAAIITTACFAASIGFKMHSEMIEALQSESSHRIEYKESVRADDKNSIRIVRF